MQGTINVFVHQLVEGQTEPSMFLIFNKIAGYASCCTLLWLCLLYLGLQLYIEYIHHSLKKLQSVLFLEHMQR